VNHVTSGMMLTVSTAVAIILSSCSAGDSSVSQESGTLKGMDNDASILNPDATAEPTWMYGSLPVCLEEGSKVQLTGLRLDATAGDELLAAGVRPLRDGQLAIGDEGGPLPATYTRIPGATVTSICEAGPATELAFEVKRTTSASAKINSVELMYLDGNTTRKLRYTFSVVLCSSPTATDLPECSSSQ
jgi:hypothetical protein